MLDFTRFRILTFDCYGTIIDWETGIFSALRPILAAHRRIVDDAGLLELYGELETEIQRAEFRPYREVLKSVVRGFGEKLGFTPTRTEENSLPDSLPSWKPWPDSVAALQKLKTRYKLAIISNTDDDLFASTSQHLLIEFEHVITAQQVRCYKPSLGIFRLALDRIGVSPEQALHVGQSIYHDVVPAQSLGMSTVWVNRPSARAGVGAVRAVCGHPDLEVHDLETLARAAVPQAEGNATTSS